MRSQYEEVADEIKRDLASTERARKEIRALYDKMEDERGAGATLAETRQKGRR